MEKRKQSQAPCLILAITFELFVLRHVALAQTYKVGIPVCDTVSTVTSYAHDGSCGPFDNLTFRLNSSLVPHVTGLKFQVVVTAIAGRIWSNLSDTVKVGDVLPLPAPVASGRLIIFLAASSSFRFITRVVGTPMSAYESYFCKIRDGLTAAVCFNYVDYLGTGQLCQVQPPTSIIRVPENHPTIQSAIHAASFGDTVLVSPGIYRENISFLGKNIIVGSLFLTSSNKAHIKQTIIDADSGSVVTFANRETKAAVLCGFTITGGTGTKIDSAKSFVYGAGILIRDANPVIKNNLITRNATWPSCFGRGGGIAIMDSANPFIAGNTITRNDILGPCSHAAYYGGGIWVDATSNPIIGGSLNNANDIFSNSAVYGLELYREGASKVINAQFNHFGGGCPPDSLDPFAVWPQRQFDLSNCLRNPVTKVSDNNHLSPPTNFQLFQNYPNPFNTATVIEFYLPRASQSRLEIFDLQGKKVATLANRKFAAGEYKMNWEPQGLASGVYVYQLRANDLVETRKLVLLR